jgi:hypothetical protein
MRHLQAHLDSLVQHLRLAPAPDRVLPKLLLRLRQEGLHTGAVGFRINRMPRSPLFKLADEAACRRAGSIVDQAA